MERYVSILGLVVMVGIAWLISNNRKAINWRLVASGIILQVVIGAFILLTPKEGTLTGPGAGGLLIGLAGAGIGLYYLARTRKVAPGWVGFWWFFSALLTFLIGMKAKGGVAEHGDLGAWMSGIAIVLILIPIARRLFKDQLQKRFGEKLKLDAFQTFVVCGVAAPLIVGGMALGYGLDSYHMSFDFFGMTRDIVAAILGFSDQGAKFIFGDGFQEHFFAFSVLPTIIFVSSLTAVLFHLGVLQAVVRFLAKIMVKLLDVSGSESLAASANVFVGQTEAPLIIKPYLPTMTQSELMAMMTGGMATVAGGVMAAYAGLGADPGHLLTASVMSAPASLILAKIMIPETEESPTKGLVKVDVPKQDANVLDAACRGAGEGLHLALNVAAMLIAFIALMALLNAGLKLMGTFESEYLGLTGGAEPNTGPLTFEALLGGLMRPMAWLMGVEWADTGRVGTLLGIKTIVNEFVAYLSLAGDITGNVPAGVKPLSDRSILISTYALCGFANFSSIAIQIGGIGALVPERRKDFAKIGLRAMVGGTLAAFMTATVAGMLLSDDQITEMADENRARLGIEKPADKGDVEGDADPKADPMAE